MTTEFKLNISINIVNNDEAIKKKIEDSFERLEAVTYEAVCSELKRMFPSQPVEFAYIT